ncbi:MAG TPA: DUF1360 domain-containing protein [Streptosporangiaceae bacterium]
MTLLDDVKAKVTDLARSSRREYAGDENRPLGGYVGTMTVYATLVGGIATLARASGRDIPEGLDLKDVALSAAATHKLSRLLAKDAVTSPLRAPFAEYQGTSGPSELKEEVRGDGAQKAVGELITCPFCTGVWVATGLTAGLIYLPRTTRLAIGTLASLAGADMLQLVYAWLQKESS